ncbi:hypothetical protein [Nostoc favosum]|uniref:Uncharacterized protein n=1 Tax=Nostoc favosum CHAB5714 TaxID=2780399 RepID=A0ABS8IG65_9NOSO|nr:hypothetical protein [Nostoc favosum]MCC5603245.1 hypothetical protein [Nostoc favosum CHAB5714]
MATESNAIRQAIASIKADFNRNQRDYRDRGITTQTEVQEAEAFAELAREEINQYQQMGNTGAIAIRP